MPELGSDLKECHEEIGHYIAIKNIDYLYTYGNISINIDNGAIAFGYPKDKILHIRPSNIDKLYEELIKTIQRDTVILIKGASGLNMYEIVRYLCKYYKN